jgi:16S rRNA (cytidine1402-2'-O)-methyltransferase
LVTALSASGLASDKFTFEGFLPSKQVARKQALENLKNETRTMIFYESPRRLDSTLNDMGNVFGRERPACLARELTKLHETIVTKPLAELQSWVESDSNQQRGECVVLVEGNRMEQNASESEVARVLALLLDDLPVKRAAAITASLLSVSKNKAYEQALKLQQK